ncbi:flagellar protein [Rhizobium sp. PAMB 3182]
MTESVDEEIRVDDIGEAFGEKRVSARTISKVDRALAVTGFLLALAAASFPWYVFFNEEKFKVEVAEGPRTRDLPETPPRQVLSVSPLAMTDNDNIAPPSNKQPDADPLQTASVPKVAPRDNSASLDQPFPVKSGFQLLHVSNGQALIEDRSGVYMVRVGSVLPDNSRLASLEQREGKWVLITSNGDVIGDEQVQIRHPSVSVSPTQD